MVELLVVVAILGVLLGLLLPALSHAKESSKETVCANNLRQLGAATLAYLNVWDDHLPQVSALNPFTNTEEIIGSLFCGKKGTLPAFGIDQIGAADRPLNSFLGDNGFIPDTTDDGINTEDVPACQCPLDRGQPAQPPFVPEADSMYDLIGTSYTLNDHTLDSEACGTLVPKQSQGKPGGRMPTVERPELTWMLADIPVYNYQEGGDRQQRWHFHDERVNMCFCDGHVDAGIKMPDEVINTTKFYTFLPRSTWDCDPNTAGVQQPAP